MKAIKEELAIKESRLQTYCEAHIGPIELQLKILKPRLFQNINKNYSFLFIFCFVYVASTILVNQKGGILFTHTISEYSLNAQM